MLIRLVIPGLPIAQPRQRIAVRGGRAVNYTPQTVGKGANRKPNPIVEFKALIRLVANAEWQGPPLTGPLMLGCQFIFPRPKAKQWKTKEQPWEWHAQKPDMDNLIKSVKDALTDILWVDDAQVCAYDYAAKRIAAGGETARTIVTVREISGR